MRLDKAVSVGPIKFEKLLLIVVLLELLLGGNGYLTEIYGIRLRVWLAVLCMAFVAYRLVKRPSAGVQIEIWVLFFLFLAVTGFGTIIGLLNDSRTDAILNELKPLFYFPMLLFFAMAIRDEGNIARVTRLIVICGIAQAFAYLTVMALVHSGTIQYSTIYYTLKASDEFIFRDEGAAVYFGGFLYKGALHMCIAAIFLWFEPLWKNRILALVLMVAIVLTFTRGLVAALILTFAYSALLNVNRKTILALALALIALIVFGISIDLIGMMQRPVSDQVRLADLRTFLSEIDLTMLLIGDGLGAEIGQRERIEMTYVEILYKQGLIGLLFWLGLFLFNLGLYRRIKNAALRQQAFVFHLATFFVYVTTASNTFLTGSIGMAVVLISTVILMVLNKLDAGQSGRGVTARVPLRTSQ